MSRRKCSTRRATVRPSTSGLPGASLPLPVPACNSTDEHDAPRSIITYVMLCGYSPFRSDDVKELIRETTEAKIEFHERYWGNVSPEGMLHPRFRLASAFT